MGADARELRDFAMDLGRQGGKVKDQAEKVVFKGSLNIKKGMQEELKASSVWGRIARFVDFDVEVRPNGVEAEIGPKDEGSGNLANVAYFGTSRGGGTVDFMKPFNDEKPRFEKAIEEVLRNVL